MSNRKHRKSIKPATRAKAALVAARLYERDQLALRTTFGGPSLSGIYRSLHRNR